MIDERLTTSDLPETVSSAHQRMFFTELSLMTCWH